MGVLARSDELPDSTMKARTIIGIGTAAIWLTATGFSDQYDDLVKKGYRWVTTDGPFACRSKEDVQRLINNQTDEDRLKMVSQGGVYYLIRGVIVQVVQEDKASGLSQVHWDGIVADLWAPSKFLSKQPITNILGTIATPAQPIGVSKSDVNTQLDVTATPGASATPTHGEAAEPGASLAP
jgi:hypothetical protein